MADEAIPVEGPTTTHDWTVNDASGIPQYSLMEGSDPRTAQLNTGAGGVFAGIAMTEKEANSGSTDLGLTKEGNWVLTAASGGSIAMGVAVVMSGINTFRTASAGELLPGAIVGKAEEAIAAGTTGEVKGVGNA